MRELSNISLQTSKSVSIKDLELRLNTLSRDFTSLRTSLSTVQYEEPAKPREGNFAYADGSTWDPGSGRGLYQYDGSAWVKL